MLNSFVYNNVLSNDPVVAALHQDGLQSALAGDFGAAHQTLRRAEAAAETLPDSLNAVVQRSRIVRDDGFVSVREALADRQAGVIDQARRTLLRAAGLTAPLVSGLAFLKTDNPLPHDTPKAARREVKAEHGATLSLLGRAATVRQVVLGIDSRGDSEAARQARNVDQQPYGLAHDFLCNGNNGYYRVSNAMLGARQERINGRLPQTGVWLGRAAFGLAWTAVRNPVNMSGAAKTIRHRIKDVRSYQAALASVSLRP